MNSYTPRHPLVLLARKFESDLTSDTPWCLGEVATELLNGKASILVWAIGSLTGYARRAEMLCAKVDPETGQVDALPVEEAQGILRAMKELDSGNGVATIDVEHQLEIAERELLGQFNEVTQTFNSRNAILVEKAKRSVRSQAERKIAYFDRRLAEPGLNENLRRMFTSSNANTRNEIQPKLAQIEQRGGVRSSLQVIGLAVVHPART